MQQPSTRQPAVWLVTRDFRLADNAALTEAAKHSLLLPLLVLEPSMLCAEDASMFHLSAQLNAAVALQKSLRICGSDLFIAVAEIPDIITRLHTEIGFSAIYRHQETGNALSFARDRALADWCQFNKVAYIEETQNGVLRGPHKRVDRAKILAQRLLQTEPLEAPSRLPHYPTTNALQNAGLMTTDVLTVSSLPKSLEKVHRSERFDAETLQPVNEQAAHRDMHEFLHQRGQHYSSDDLSSNLKFTKGSRLSVHLAWGTLTLRQVFHARNRRMLELGNARDASSTRWRNSLNAFQSRLFWHDHFVQRFESASFMEFKALNPAYEGLQYTDDGTNLQRWISAETGLPLVDACLRCVQANGFLNFRMRAMLVSVACYGLGIHWRDVQYPLARWFHDYEPGIHFSQVQMQAGVVGINTIRVYNPQKQLLEQDSNCDFTKRWLPELADFTAEEIAQYPTRPLGRYPASPADFEANTKVMKDRIFDIRKSLEGRRASAEILQKYGSRTSPLRQRLRSNYEKDRISRQNPSDPSTAGNEKNNPSGDTAKKQLTLDF